MASNAPSTLRQSAPWIAALIGGIFVIVGLGIAAMAAVANIAFSQALPTATPIPLPTATPTATQVAAAPSPTVAALVIVTPPPTNTPLPTATPTATATPTPTNSATPTPTPTPTSTATPTTTPTPTVTPADVSALGALVPLAAAPTMPPDPSEEEFLATSAALSAGYLAAIPALETHMTAVNADPVVLTYGDWVRGTSDLIAHLRSLNAQARALPVPPRYAASWQEMLRSVELLAGALDKLNDGISLYKLELIGEYERDLAAAKVVMVAAVPAIAPLPVVVVSVPTAVILPVAGQAVAIAPVPSEEPCNVCPSPTVSAFPEKGGAPPVIMPPTATPDVVPTVVVSVPITVPVVAVPSPASGGLGLTLDIWIALYGPPDAVVGGLYLFDEADSTYSLLLVNGRISTIYVAWKPEHRPTLPVAQGAALRLIPRDSSLIQATSLSADRFVGQYQSPQLAISFPDAPFAPRPAGSFLVIYELAADGLVFQMIVTIGDVAG